jgi:hypothetical protein
MHNPVALAVNGFDSTGSVLAVQLVLKLLFFKMSIMSFVIEKKL